MAKFTCTFDGKGRETITYRGYEIRQDNSGRATVNFGGSEIAVFSSPKLAMEEIDLVQTMNERDRP